MLVGIKITVDVFVNNFPRYKWIRLFEKRHPELTLRILQRVNVTADPNMVS